MHQPIISVIIPVYNVEKYLDRCIGSVVNQTYTNIEIILVDDGSVDNSAKICDLWAEKDNRIKVIHKSNEGAGIARNAGLDVASGDYVLFVDSDDFIDHKTAECCVHAAERDGSEIVIYGRADVRQDGSIKEKTILTYKYLYKDSDVTEDLFSSLCTHSKGLGLGVVGKMMKMNIIKENGIRFFSEREILSEDAIFLAEFFSYVKSATIVPDYHYMCVLHDDSLSNNFRSDFQQKNNTFLQKINEISDRVGYSENIKNHLKIRYLSYELAVIKQIVKSKLPFNQKLRNIKNLSYDRTLYSVFTNEVFGVMSLPHMLFWKLFKAKCGLLCYIMIKIKI